MPCYALSRPTPPCPAPQPDDDDPVAEEELDEVHHALGVVEGREGERSLRVRFKLADAAQAGNALGLRRWVGWVGGLTGCVAHGAWLRQCALQQRGCRFCPAPSRVCRSAYGCAYCWRLQGAHDARRAGPRAELLVAAQAQQHVHDPARVGGGALPGSHAAEGGAALGKGAGRRAGGRVWAGGVTVAQAACPPTLFRPQPLPPPPHTQHALT